MSYVKIRDDAAMNVVNDFHSLVSDALDTLGGARPRVPSGAGVIGWAGNNRDVCWKQVSCNRQASPHMIGGGDQQDPMDVVQPKGSLQFDQCKENIFDGVL